MRDLWRVEFSDHKEGVKVVYVQTGTGCFDDIDVIVKKHNRDATIIKAEHIDAEVLSE